MGQIIVTVLLLILGSKQIVRTIHKCRHYSQVAFRFFGLLKELSPDIYLSLCAHLVTGGVCMFQSSQNFNLKKKFF